MFCTDLDALITNLKRRGFTVHTAANGAEAKSIALELIEKEKTVGFGGSVTVSNELELYNALNERGNTCYAHWFAADKDEARKQAAKVDWYLASSNAILRDGRLVNIDGTCNRVTSMLIGPERVMLFIGKNKLANDLEDGIARIKHESCPKNARRLKLDELPCGITGECADCSSEQRMCRVTTILEFVPRAIKEYHLVLIDEVMGW